MVRHPHGEVIKNGIVVGYFEYDGARDLAVNPIWKSLEEVDKHCYRYVHRKCECGSAPEVVTLFTGYGREIHWQAFACLECGAITKGLSPSWLKDERDDVECSNKLSEYQFEIPYPNLIAGPQKGHPLKEARE